MGDHVHPRPGQLDAMASHDPDEPVYMLNLLRYEQQAKPGLGADGMTGEEAFREYGRRFATLADRFGGEPIWMGEPLSTVIGPDDEDWDVVIVVRYPTRRQFLSMLADPGYQEMARLRTAGVADSRLVEMRQLLG